MASLKSLAGKTVFITGASRGIGRSIALKCARDKANIVVAAKSSEPHPKLPGTIHSVAKEIEYLGAKALPVCVDVRFEEQISDAIQKTVQRFGGIDILINNAGAINLTNTANTTMKSYDLMNQINARATFMCTKLCLPFLEKSVHAHVLNLSPPISLNPRWLQNNVAYTISKYGMSLCTLGMAEEFRDKRIAVNSLWPKTAIATAAIEWILGSDALKHSRYPEIVADAAYEIFKMDPSEFTGKTVLDEEILMKNGIHNFDKYAITPNEELYPDFYIEK